MLWTRNQPYREDAVYGVGGGSRISMRSLPFPCLRSVLPRPSSVRSLTGLHTVGGLEGLFPPGVGGWPGKGPRPFPTNLRQVRLWLVLREISVRGFTRWHLATASAHKHPATLLVGGRVSSWIATPNGLLARRRIWSWMARLGLTILPPHIWGKWRLVVRELSSAPSRVRPADAAREMGC